MSRVWKGYDKETREDTISFQPMDPDADPWTLGVAEAVGLAQSIMLLIQPGTACTAVEFDGRKALRPTPGQAIQ